MSDHDDDDSEKPADFANLLGPEPTWETCACGAVTSRPPCWDCTRAFEARANETARGRLSVSSIPDRYGWAKLGTPELNARVKSREPLLTIAKRVLASERVVFAGPSGAGKTSFGVACLRERVPHGIFVSAIKLGTARIQSKAGDGEPVTVDRAMKAPLLLLDEVGGESKTATNAVKDVIFARYDDNLPTWITTGFKGEQIAEMYGDGMFRRLIENVTIVQLGAKT